ncbi:hypothetical protein [Microbulbifer sp. YPW16]|uniref:hypothetical protein n=1 Tax=Microbulbifer sp. YPW16 TaxID=2904242 RepID=UPI001E3AEEAC|nr:hypothetical protein [Microbulbifer sp. YPW16]UHQ55857.1 hypothetical protein LVE68_02385 [Microbulbifer sp. YPW16]
MTDLILHIGRHKTGTTAIQRFLAANRDWLAQRGYMYPKTGVRGYGHHRIAESMPRRRIGIINAPEARDLASSVLEEIGENSGLTPILSSEAFQQCPPWIVRHYLRAQQCKVIVYLRNHLSYLPSAYTQKVHATGYSGTLQDFYQEFYKQTDYLKFTRGWERTFPGGVDLRIYDKPQLYRENIVLDFIRHALDIQEEEVSPERLPSGDANPSLNEKVVQFKRHINETGEVARYSGKGLYRALPKLNQLFPAPKVMVTPELASRLIERNARRDGIVARTYLGKETLFDYDGEPTRKEQQISGNDIAAMREKLEEILSPS